MRAAAARLLAALFLSAALAGGLVACGGDDQQLDLGDDPSISVPQASPVEQTETAPNDTSTESGNAGTTEDQSGSGGGGVAVPSPSEQRPSYDPNGVDSPTNDKPPAPGSPEEAFEQACDSGDCG